MKKLLFILILPIVFMGCTQSQFASLPCDQLIDVSDQIACHSKKLGESRNTRMEERIAIRQIAADIVARENACKNAEPLVVLTGQ